MTLPQFTPSPKTCPGFISELARPTPTMAPMSECDELAGSPMYHVPRFQMIAESSRAKTIA